MMMMINEFLFNFYLINKVKNFNNIFIIKIRNLFFFNKCKFYYLIT